MKVHHFFNQFLDTWRFLLKFSHLYRRASQKLLVMAKPSSLKSSLNNQELQTVKFFSVALQQKNLWNWGRINLISALKTGFKISEILQQLVKNSKDFCGGCLFCSLVFHCVIPVICHELFEEDQNICQNKGKNRIQFWWLAYCQILSIVNSQANSFMSDFCNSQQRHL